MNARTIWVLSMGLLAALPGCIGPGQAEQDLEESENGEGRLETRRVEVRATIVGHTLFTTEDARASWEESCERWVKFTLDRVAPEHVVEISCGQPFQPVSG